MEQPGTADRVDRAALSRRWRQEGRYDEIAEFRQQVKEATKKAWKSAGRQWDRDELNEVAWQEAARAFPPLDTGRTLATDSQSELAHGGRVTGLSDIPSSWRELPANASLQAEISWVTANRLRVRDGNGVDLSKAKTPAPSYSALSWLETSILFPSKFADISVKATSQQDDEREHIRREKLAQDGGQFERDLSNRKPTRTLPVVSRESREYPCELPSANGLRFGIHVVGRSALKTVH